jgi:hypothetical protein
MEGKEPGMFLGNPGQERWLLSFLKKTGIQRIVQRREETKAERLEGWIGW